MTKQAKLIKFLLNCPVNTWHTFAKDYQTVSLVCATSNLGILKVNQHGQMAVKCKTAANRFLNK